MEDARYNRMVGTGKQEAWTKGEHTTGHKIWAKLWRVKSHWFSPCLMSCRVLPTCAAGALWIQLVNAVRKRDAWRTSSAAVQRPWKRGGMLAPWPSSEGNGRNHLHWHQIQQTVTSNKAHHHLFSSGGEASALAKSPGWSALNSKRLAAPGWPRETNEVPALQLPHRPDLVLMSVTTQQVMVL